MQKLSKALQDIIDDLVRKNFADAKTTWDKMSTFQRKKVLQYLGEPGLDGNKKFYELSVKQAGKISTFIDQMMAQKN